MQKKKPKCGFLSSWIHDNKLFSQTPRMSWLKLRGVGLWFDSIACLVGGHSVPPLLSTQTWRRTAAAVFACRATVPDLICDVI